jgi:DNA polymerase-3 subunit gamma/tau
MSEIALYRKYRPKKFGDVVGQDHIVSVLENAIREGRIAHAYLFAGSRGTGKTSVARILANELGCDNQDLYEIDAASSRGIDDIRELREAVRTLPFRSQYKVYIIDEVHMLTKEAFNALLKTLEEPPLHVIFILATTEMHKLPDTIISRCQTFQFKKPSVESLRQVTAEISKKEKCSLDEESIKLIAILGDGSFRDTVGILQKVISSFGQKEISRADVELITGAPKRDAVYALINGIMEKDANKALSAVHETMLGDCDMKFFLKIVLDTLRIAMLGKFAPQMEKDLIKEVGEDEYDLIKKIIDHDNSRYLSAILKELLYAYDDTGKTYLPELPLEIAIIKIIGSMKEEEK